LEREKRAPQTAGTQLRRKRRNMNATGTQSFSTSPHASSSDEHQSLRQELEILEGLQRLPENQRGPQLYREASNFLRLRRPKEEAEKILILAALLCNPPIPEALVCIAVDRAYKHEQHPTGRKKAALVDSQTAQEAAEASPQLKDGFGRIAGEIMLAFARTNLSKHESRVIWFVLSKTYRWKLSCAISKWDLVFPKKDGAPHDRKTILRSGLYPAIRRAEVKKLDMHALRHTFASLLLSQGTPITEVSSYLAHADPQITLKVYSHWIPRTKTDSISRLAGLIFNAKQAAKEEKTSEVAEVAQ
jgi:hypothetical protein